MLIPTTLSSSERNNNNYLQLCGSLLSTLLEQQPEGKQQRKRVMSFIHYVSNKRLKQLRSVHSGGQPNFCSTASSRQQFRQSNETILNPNEPLPRSCLKFNQYQWKRLRNRGIDMMKRLHLRHLKKCDYHRILNRHCPLPSFDVKEREPNHGQQMVGLEDLIAAHSPATLYYRRPVWSALRRRGIISLLSGGQFTEYTLRSAEKLDTYFTSNRKIPILPPPPPIFQKR
jgi:hypothetical protein